MKAAIQRERFPHTIKLFVERKDPKPSARDFKHTHMHTNETRLSIVSSRAIKEIKICRAFTHCNSHLTHRQMNDQNFPPLCWVFLPLVDTSHTTCPWFGLVSFYAMRWWID